MTIKRASFRDETWFHALVLAVAYFVLAKFANQFAFPPHPSAVLWFPSGLSLAFLLRSPLQRWGALLAALFVAEVVSVLSHDFPIPLWIAGLWGLANCLRTFVGAYLMRHFVGTAIRLSRRWEIAGLLIFGGLLSPLLSATLGSWSYTCSSEPSSFLGDWVNWWLSDGLGTVLIAPLLLTWTPTTFRSKRWRRLGELGLMLILTALGAHFIFHQTAHEGVIAALVYLVFPFVLWASLRMGPLGAASTSAVVAIVALGHTMRGQGPFGALTASLPEKVLALQTFVVIVSVTALTVAALISERWRTEELQQLLVEAGAVLAASLDIRETFPRVAHLVVPRACAGFAVWLAGEDGRLELAGQAGWHPARDARLRGHLPPLPTEARRFSTPESTTVVAPLRVLGKVEGALVLMIDERARYAGGAELSLAEELARRCGIALESARLFAETQQAIEARNEFIAMAAHELRTPLTSLTLRAQSVDRLLRREQASELAREKVSAMSRQIGRLGQLVERVLDVGRIGTGLLEIHREAVDVTGLVAQVAGSFADAATHAGSELRVEGEPGLTAWWGRDRIEQALANLVANALKFGAGHPIEIRVSREEQWVRIVVRDQGIGIAPEDIERIFQRFERAMSPSKYGGLGLGLFFTREIAASHGGTIHAESEPGKGATFVLELPVGERA